MASQAAPAPVVYPHGQYEWNPAKGPAGEWEWRPNQPAAGAPVPAIGAHAGQPPAQLMQQPFGAPAQPAAQPTWDYQRGQWVYPQQHQATQRAQQPHPAAWQMSYQGAPPHAPGVHSHTQQQNQAYMHPGFPPQHSHPPLNHPTHQQLPLMQQPPPQQQQQIQPAPQPAPQPQPQPQQQPQAFRLQANQPIVQTYRAPVAAVPAPASAATAQAAAAQNSAAGAGGQAQWPPSLRAYVERAFKSVQGDDGRRALMQTMLKAKIKDANESGRLWQQDWDTEPLPSLHTQHHMQQQHMQQQQQQQQQPALGGWGAVHSVGRSDAPPQANHDHQQQQQQGAGGLGGWGVVHHQTEPPSPAGKAGKGKKKTKAQMRKEAAAAKKEKQRMQLQQRGRKRGRGADDDDALAANPEEIARRQRRAAKYGGGAADGAGASYQPERPKRIALLGDETTTEDKEVQWDKYTVQGSSEALEKRYLRLTSAPDPTTVRPPGVLEKALAHVLEQHKVHGYFWTCDQLKAIRQDLTVQRIKNELTVRVYEEHARLAIIDGDVVNYNQCATQLLELHTAGIAGCHAEFAAYRVLYCLLTSELNTERHLDTLAALKTVCCSKDSGKLLSDPAVKHALGVRAAVYTNAYVTLFRLAKERHNLNGVFIDQFIDKARFAACNTIVRAYRPNMALPPAAMMLGFCSTGDGDTVTGKASDDEPAGLGECYEWLRAHGAVLVGDPSAAAACKIDCKESVGKLAVPEKVEAVAHGDVNMSVENFLTKAIA